MLPFIVVLAALWKARSADGTLVPFTCLRPRNCGEAPPTLVYAYGGGTGPGSRKEKHVEAMWVCGRRERKTMGILVEDRNIKPFYMK